jgi:squalene-hopene/tetraprenyl-beta-curcumene cyclase
MPRLCVAALVAALALSCGLPGVRAEEAVDRAVIAPPTPNKKNEPVAAKLSAARAAEFLDSVGVHWTRERKCGTCHTNVPYVMARPALIEKGKTAPGYEEVRKFFEDRVANWDSGRTGTAPRWDAEVVTIAVALAFSDAYTTGKLHPLTRQALDRMWTVQQKSGGWNWLKCDWPPMEHDDYYGAAFAAVGVAHAPDGYARTEKAQEGLARLRDYFRKTPAPDLHHRTMLLWAAAKLDGLMTPAEKAATIKDLLALQRADGGWSLPSLGEYKRRDGKPNDRNAPSDGYATGLVVYVLRQAGQPIGDPVIQRGVAWLKGNQRTSGRWFTFSLNNDKAHYITNAGTGLAVLALHACDALRE